MEENKRRWFPFLGIKTLTDEDVMNYDLPYDCTYKALVFEWFDLYVLLVAVGKPA